MDKKHRQHIIRASLDRPSLPSRQYSLAIRHLDCGSCNACELELNALTNQLYDIEQYGIHFEASPRHADILAMTGPYTRGLDEAARLTLEAMPIPRIVTIGDCANDGGLFQNTYAVINKPEVIKKAIIHHIPGCPPTPKVILAALLTIAERVNQEINKTM